MVKVLGNVPAVVTREGTENVLYSTSGKVFSTNNSEVVEEAYAETSVPFESSSVYSELFGAMPGLVVTVIGKGKPVEIEAFFPGVYSSSHLYAKVIPFISHNDLSIVATYASSIAQDTGNPVVLKRRMVLESGVSYTFKAGVFALEGGVKSNIFAGGPQRAYLSVMTR